MHQNEDTFGAKANYYRRLRLPASGVEPIFNGGARIFLCEGR